MTMLRFAAAIAVALLLSCVHAFAACTATQPARPGYVASVTGLVTAASATDIATLTGSATRTVCVFRARVSCHGSSAARVNVTLVRRSAANTAGTSAAMTAAKLDSDNPAATATALSYTANPSGLGASAGIVGADAYIAPTANNPTPSIFNFGDRPGEQPVVLRGTSELLAVSLEGQTITGGECDISFRWWEE